MRVYNLDLESLLPLLAEFQQDGSLSAVLPSGVLKQKGPCKVRIDLVQGKVVYCHIEDSARHIHILDGRKIADTLYGLGEFDWRLDEGVDKLYSSRVDPYQTQPLPRQDRIPGPYQTQPLPRQDRIPGPYQTQPLPRQDSVPRQYPVPPSTQYSPPFQSAQRQSVSSLVPRVIAVPDTSILNSLSRNQRRVLVLVDGTRNIKKITEILFPSTHDMRAVLQILRELENMGLVVIAG
jgi:hypothetical protein